MAKILVQVFVPMLLLVLVAIAGATPPGIANNPSHATCRIKKYKHCYNLVHVCPKFCPSGCTVECASCKPICVGAANPPPDSSPTPTSPSTPENPPPSTPSTPENPPPSTPSTPENPPPSTPSTPENPPPSTPSTPENPPPSTPSTPENPPPSTPSTPENPPPSTPSTPENPPPSTPSTPENPPPSTPSTPENPPPSPSTPSTPSTPENPPPSPSTPSSPENPTPSPSAPSTPENPPPSTPSTPQNPSPSTPSTPENPSPSPATPSSPTPSSPSPSTPSPTTPPSSPTPSSPKTARCRNKNYPKCYNMEHACPSACPGGCEVDCNTCKPVCKCDKPGAVCQDPRFIGGDGITFYFHGKKDTNFCLVSDPNLHINAHFIGRRNHNMNRDFTWVQSIAILFDNHHLFIGAHKTATWHDSIDRLAISFDGKPITIAQSEGATWQSPTGGVSITRDAGTNSVTVEVEGKLKVTAKVVPITEEDSRVHKYEIIPSEDCFAHLDLGFKFLSLSNEVSGVLGQTYRPNYVSRVNIGAKMAVMGGVREFQTSNLFSTDCSVARFVGKDGRNSENGNAMMEGSEILPGLSCASGVDGQGVVCKR